MIPDGKSILIGYLNDHADMVALEARVASKIPSSIKAKPWVRVVQLDGRNDSGSRVEHLIEFVFDLHCYASETGGTVEASLVARTARAALQAMPDDDTLAATVTSVRFAGMADLPDPDMDDRDRTILTAIVHMHA